MLKVGSLIRAGIVDSEPGGGQRIAAGIAGDYYPVLSAAGLLGAEQDRLSFLQQLIDSLQKAGALGDHLIVTGPVQVSG